MMNTGREFPVAIIGAGPIGLAAAANLAARGGMARAAENQARIRRVSVRDRQKAQIRVVICHAMHPNDASGPERDFPGPR